jgi:imidazole glycerol-phosphate synthase subunit HisH
MINELEKIKVSIIDYGMGNLFSVEQACRYVGLEPVITSDKNEILNSRAAILPGVGAFGDAMDNLEKLDLISPIKDFIKTGKPLLGVCLGMQLLFSESEEFGAHKGLNIIEGSVVKFRKESEPVKVPQIAWNQIYPPDSERWKESPLKDMMKGEYMYFIHSYYARPHNNKNILSLTNYEGIEYCSSVKQNNVFAFQFHPEKSAFKGIEIYSNWAKGL